MSHRKRAWRSVASLLAGFIGAQVSLDIQKEVTA
jgi:hypothetical protein